MPAGTGHVRLRRPGTAPRPGRPTRVYDAKAPAHRRIGGPPNDLLEWSAQRQGEVVRILGPRLTSRWGAQGGK